MKFLASGVQEERLMMLSTIFFFLGIVIVLVLDVLVHQLEHVGTPSTQPMPVVSPRASSEMDPTRLQEINEKPATY